MHVVSSARLVLARRPWLYWAAVAAFATITLAGLHRELASIAAARAEWGETRTVLVADRRLEPGDPVVARPRELPRALVPDAALTAPAAGATVRQRVAAGEVLTELDVTRRAGPAALGMPGTVVVALSDPLARDVVTGLAVQVVADGVVLAEAAEVTAIVDEVVFVAVAEAEGAAVATAARQGVASLLYLP